MALSESPNLLKCHFSHLMGLTAPARVPCCLTGNCKNQIEIAATEGHRGTAHTKPQTAPQRLSHLLRGGLCWAQDSLGMLTSPCAQKACIPAAWQVRIINWVQTSLPLLLWSQKTWAQLLMLPLPRCATRSLNLSEPLFSLL